MSNSSKIIGVDVDRVGKPRNDGSRGSALYDVPLILNTPRDATWRQIFDARWAIPRSTMHRRAHATADRIVVENTTIEEVEQYHLPTLRVVLPEVDADAIAAEANALAERERIAAESEVHDANIREVARRMKFED